MLPDQKPVSFWRTLPVTGCCSYSQQTARGRHSTKIKKKHHSINMSHLPTSKVSSGRGVNRQASVQVSLVVNGAAASRAQSSLSDRVSYCSDSRDCQTLCWATGAPVGGGGGGGCCCCCCWLCMEGEAMQVGGVLLRMRIVSGL